MRSGGAGGAAEMGYHWDFTFLTRYTRLFVTGAEVTVGFTFGTVLLALLLGLLLGLGRLTRSRLLNLPLVSFIELFRCTPLLVQIVWFYYALPIVLGINLPAWFAAGIGLSLYMGAFTTEIVRAGLLSIDSGQWQAASALGLSRLLALRLVIIPQAMRRMVPPLVSQAVLQLKNTALLSIVAVPELMQRSSVIVSDTFRPLEVYSLLAAIYFVLLFPIVMLSKRLEVRFQ